MAHLLLIDRAVDGTAVVEIINAETLHAEEAEASGAAARRDIRGA